MRCVSFNGSRVEIKRHAADFGTLSYYKCRSIENSLRSPPVHDSVVFQVTGHLCEESFVRNGVVQIPKFDASSNQGRLLHITDGANAPWKK